MSVNDGLTEDPHPGALRRRPGTSKFGWCLDGHHEGCVGVTFPRGRSAKPDVCPCTELGHRVGHGSDGKLF